MMIIMMTSTPHTLGQLHPIEHSTYLRPVAEVTRSYIILMTNASSLTAVAGMDAPHPRVDEWFWTLLLLMLLLLLGR